MGSAVVQIYFWKYINAARAGGNKEPAAMLRNFLAELRIDIQSEEGGVYPNEGATEALECPAYGCRPEPGVVLRKNNGVFLAYHLHKAGVCRCLPPVPGRGSHWRQRLVR
jgi:hypothetical protein